MTPQELDNEVKNLGLDSRTQTLVQILVVVSYNSGYQRALSTVQNTLKYYEEK